MKCDFCSDPDVRWWYPAKSFEVPEFKLKSIEDWAACDTCHALIEKGKRVELLIWSVNQFYAQYPELEGQVSPAVILEQVKKLHEGFYQYRTGEVKRYEDSYRLDQ